jgi:hypothetical protein
MADQPAPVAEAQPQVVQQEVVYSFRHPETGVPYVPTPMLRWMRTPSMKGKVLEQLYLSVPDQQPTWMPVPTFTEVG